MTQHLETTRLTLRPWRESDADALFRYAHDPDVGPRAGWAAHESVEESRRVIREVLAMPESYAIVLKRRAGDLPVGAIALMFGAASDLARSSREAELGYWVGRPLWGQGVVPEAAAALLEHAFSDLRLDAVWASYYEGNEQSRRVQEKLGFVPDCIIESLPRPLLGDAARTHVNVLSRERWTRMGHAHRGLIDEQQAEKRDIVESLSLVALVRSGGQTGADRGALDAAREMGVALCGWCPAGGLAEDCPEAPGLIGPYPELRETPSAGYIQRTAWNVRDSHATLIVSPGGLEPKSGTEATVDFARAYGRPVLVIEGAGEVSRAREWLEGIGRELTLNVAGPRASKAPEVYEITRGIVRELLS